MAVHRLIVEDDARRIAVFKKFYENISDTLQITDSVSQAISILNKGNITHLHLDNDLGLNKKEGREVARRVVHDYVNGKEYPTHLQEIIIHSQNSVAADYMESMLSRHLDWETIVVLARPYTPLDYPIF